jgi:hypothetical protein
MILIFLYKKYLKTFIYLFIIIILQKSLKKTP